LANPIRSKTKQSCLELPALSDKDTGQVGRLSLVETSDPDKWLSMSTIHFGGQKQNPAYEPPHFSFIFLFIKKARQDNIAEKNNKTLIPNNAINPPSNGPVIPDKPMTEFKNPVAVACSRLF